MENPMTWGPIQRCLAAHPASSPQELVDLLASANLLLPNTDRGSLTQKFEKEIAKFHSQAAGFCGLSLHTRLANLVR